MSSILSSCFGHRGDPTFTDVRLHNGTTPPAGHRKIDDVNPAKCVFCNVTPDRFNIVLQDEQFICFKDRSPGAAIHLLVIPRTHIANVQSLTRQDVELVKQMQALGNKALDSFSSSTAATERRVRLPYPSHPQRRSSASALSRIAVHKSIQGDQVSCGPTAEPGVLQRMVVVRRVAADVCTARGWSQGQDFQLLGAEHQLYTIIDTLNIESALLPDHFVTQAAASTMSSFTTLLKVTFCPTR